MALGFSGMIFEGRFLGGALHFGAVMSFVILHTYCMYHVSFFVCVCDNKNVSPVTRVRQLPRDILKG